MNYGSVRTERIEHVLRVIAEVRECAPHERRFHLIRGLLRIVGGRFAALLTLSDFRAGGRGTPRDFVVAGHDESIERLLSLHLAEGACANPAVARLMELRRADDPPVRVATRSELVADADWYRTPFVAEHLRAADADHAIYAARYRASSELVRGFTLVRGWGDRPFEPEDAALVHIFNLAADDLLDDDGPSWPQPRRPLAPREAQVLELLLGGQNEKQLADCLDLSIHTIHQYTKAVFRAFAVSSRAELMAKFIAARRSPPALTPSTSLRDSS
ncbi:helix-turn-helix transcriptional regulator [Nannocystis radixulma]|uniref:Helix-turn-helix transcriptional regulator n=1 Tax=Nannocystis radixulma TaxID=2995305 RepID=A0ABT5BP01_9BACT|nr:helix-turn-helix transcriptional regulator [Nannocystis radixulma]MDC0675900.1 helix-turn-helix transcriptional regulator [Nannocystis radixulma]